MKILNVFDKEVANQLTNRIKQLTPESKPLWGTMDVAKMIAHCNVTYEMVFDDIHQKPGTIQRFFLKLFVKKIVVSELPYKKNSRTAPQFIIKSDKDFNTELTRLIAYIEKCQQLGATYFEGKESHSFGPLTAQEWNNMFYKHLDHHLQQFGS